jgi:hypothetical protein
MILLAGMRRAAISRVVRRLQGPARRRGFVPFSLGWASRWRGERLQTTISRADRQLIAERVADRSEPLRLREKRRPPPVSRRRGRGGERP